jgi:thiol-disulfide isomerase/thioredoxin
MRLQILLLAALVVPSGMAQSHPDALAILNNSTRQYWDASSYRVEAVQERTSAREFQRDWQKELLVAVVAPSGKYRYEGRSGTGSSILVSDGRTRWNYHVDAQTYTQTAPSTANSGKNSLGPMQEEMAARDAKRLLTNLVMLPTQAKSAILLADQKIVLNRHVVNCYVIHIGEKDFRTDQEAEETIWIDQSRHLIRKTHSRTKTYFPLWPSGARIPVVIEETTTYPVVQLNEQEPESSFTFSPPAEAKLVDSFRLPLHEPFWHEPPQLHAAHFVGKRAPDIQLPGSDGTITNLNTFRGKPIFIEFWATWCAPCLDLMPDLKQLYSSTASSVVWLSIDSDKDPGAATTYLSLEHIPWPNYHDRDGSLGKAFGRNGIPLAIVIDADGKIIFYEEGDYVAALRTALTRFSPPRMINTDGGFVGE